MTDDRNPFTNPQLLHPDLADQISGVEDWQQEHDPSARVGAMGVAATIHNAIKEQFDSGQIEGTSPEFSQLLSSARDGLISLVTDIQMEKAFAVPKLTGMEFIDTDWPRLEAGFRAYEQLGLRPDIVITPTGRSVQSWRALYSGLCDWQEHQSISGWSLESAVDGNGLYIADVVADYWEQIVPAEPGWRISVIAGTSRPPVGGVYHSGKDIDGQLPLRLTDILAKQPPHPDAAADTLATYPSVEGYLMLQAIRFHGDVPPIDEMTKTWLGGRLYTEDGIEAYPTGTVWGTDLQARVAIGYYLADSYDGSTGVRPMVQE